MESPLSADATQVNSSARLFLGVASIAAVAIFLCNEVLLNLAGEVWVMLDWTLRAAIISLFFVPSAARRALKPLFVFPGFLWTTGWVLACLAIAIIGLAFARGSPGLFKFPELSWGWAALDGLIGLPLVSLSEELAFRAAPMLLFSTLRPVYWITGSSIVFGLVHWGHGAGDVIGTALIGLGLAWSIHFTFSLWPGLIAHTLINFLFFTLPRLNEF